MRDYEQRLLDGLANGGGESHPSSLADSFGQVLDETRKALIHDAVLRFGLLSDQPTPLVRFAQAWVRAFADLPGWVPPKPGPTEYGSDQPLFASVETIHGGGLIGFI